MPTCPSTFNITGCSITMINDSYLYIDDSNSSPMNCACFIHKWKVLRFYIKTTTKKKKLRKRQRMPTCPLTFNIICHQITLINYPYRQYKSIAIELGISDLKIGTYALLQQDYTRKLKLRKHHRMLTCPSTFNIIGCRITMINDSYLYIDDSNSPPMNCAILIYRLDDMSYYNIITLKRKKKKMPERGFFSLKFWVDLLLDNLYLN